MTRPTPGATALAEATSVAKSRRKPGTSGRALETLVLASQTTVTLTQVKQAARWIKDRRTGESGPTCVKGPCDFFGCFRSDGRLLVFDAKESDDPNRLDTSVSHLSEMQRLELLRYADAGAVAGLLALCRPSNCLYWFAAHLLHPRPASIPWGSGFNMGSARFAIEWRFIQPARNGGDGFPRDDAESVGLVLAAVRGNGRGKE